MGRQTNGALSTAAKFALLGAGAAGVYMGVQAARKYALTQKNRGIKRGQKIVILGGGFAGTAAAQELARSLPNPEDGTITLIDVNDYLLFTPMLTEAAGGQIDAKHIVSPLHSLSPRVDFIQGQIESTDLDSRRVTVTVGAGSGLPQTSRELEWDQLVIALGAVTNYRNIPGLAEHSRGMKTLNDAAGVLNGALALLARADAETDPKMRRELLTIVIGGGGYTGVETMAALNDLVRDSAKRYANIRPEEIRTVLFEAEDSLLPELRSPHLAGYAQKKLEEHGVEVRLKTEVASAGPDFVELKGDERIPTRLLIWAGGVKPNPAIDSAGLKMGKHGGIIVDATCAVPDHPGIWALGDCAEIPDPKGKGAYAPTAQNATREGVQVGQNIAATLRGEKPEPFIYTPIGELALVGKQSGVAEVYGVHVSGLLAWAMWRAVYLAKMPGLTQKLRILLDWMMDMSLGRSIVELPSANVESGRTEAEPTEPQEAETPVPAASRPPGLVPA